MEFFFPVNHLGYPDMERAEKAAYKSRWQISLSMGTAYSVRGKHSFSSSITITLLSIRIIISGSNNPRWSNKSYQQ